MKILTLNYEYPPVGGGGGVAHEAVAVELARRHRVVVITSGTADLPERETREGVEIRRVRVLNRRSRSAASLISMLSYPLVAWRCGARMCRDEAFDLVNGHFAIPTGPGSLALARSRKIPHVLCIHGGDIYDPSKSLSPHRHGILRQTVRTVLGGSAATIAGSANSVDNARQYYGFTGDVDVIPYGIRFQDPAALSREELGLPPDRFILVTVGRLVARKAIDQMLTALRMVSELPVHLVVVGAGPQLETLRAVAGELGVSESVTFSGWVEETRKWELLRAADAYISTSLHEGFGLVFIEGMAMGLPVIAPDHGGQVEFLRDGETGFITPAGDTGAVADAIGRMASSPEDVARMSRNAVTLAREFRPERCAERYEEVFERVLRNDRDTR